MAGLVPAIHEFFRAAETRNVDARDKPGHDEVENRFRERLPLREGKRVGSGTGGGGDEPREPGD